MHQARHIGTARIGAGRGHRDGGAFRGGGGGTGDDRGRGHVRDGNRLRGARRTAVLVGGRQADDIVPVVVRGERERRPGAGAVRLVVLRDGPGEADRVIGTGRVGGAARQTDRYSLGARRRRTADRRRRSHIRDR